MFYVSEVKKNGFEDLYGITDTRDNVTEYLKGSDIVRIMEAKEVDIYGVDIYNHKATCTPITIDNIPNKSKLITLLDNWRKVHNPWTGRPVEDYLASLYIGTTITVKWSDRDTSGRPISGIDVIKRLSYDEWIYTGSGSTFSGQKGDSRFAASCLEVCCIYCKPVNISI